MHSQLTGITFKIMLPSSYYFRKQLAKAPECWLLSNACVGLPGWDSLFDSGFNICLLRRCLFQWPFLSVSVSVCVVDLHKSRRNEQFGQARPCESNQLRYVTSLRTIFQDLVMYSLVQKCSELSVRNGPGALCRCSKHALEAFPGPFVHFTKTTEDSFLICWKVQLYDGLA